MFNFIAKGFNDELEKTAGLSDWWKRKWKGLKDWGPKLKVEHLPMSKRKLFLAGLALGGGATLGAYGTKKIIKKIEEKKQAMDQKKSSGKV